MENVVTIASRSNFNVALTTTGNVVNWGSKEYDPFSNQQIELSDLKNISAVCLSVNHVGNHIAMLTFDGHVVCRGNTSQFGQCKVSVDLENVVSICCGYFHTSALTADGRVVCWGNNANEQCNVPPDLENVVSICCGYYHTTAVTSDGKVVCWGSNFNEQCNVPDGLVANTGMVVLM